MGRFLLPKLRAKQFWLTAILLVAAGWTAVRLGSPPAYGAQLGKRSLQVSNYEVGATAEYRLTFELPGSGLLGSIRIQFCSNDPLQTTACVAPNGFSASGAVLADQSGPVGLTISGASTANQIILTRTAATEPAGQASYDFTGITNPADSGAYYVRVQTFASDDASGPGSDYGGIAYLISNSFEISAEVPPYLLFCTAVKIPGLNCTGASGSYIDFGELSPQKTGSGTSQLLVASNAQNGYSVWADGTTLTSGNNEILALAAGDVSRPGVGQFGFNLRSNVTPAAGQDPSGPGTSLPATQYDQPNFYRFADGDTIITTAGPDDVRKYTASYIANIPAAQPAGIYVSTITYVCLANF